MVAFDEPAMINRLGRFSRRDKAAFALACARRLDPLLSEISAAERDVVRECRSLLERVVAGELGDDHLPAALATLEAQESLDVDAVASTVYAIGAWLKDSPTEAMWAARRAYEAQDQIAQSELGVMDEGQLLAHPKVQRELLEQLSDLDTLSARRA
jgi:hypothetical protein